MKSLKSLLTIGLIFGLFNVNKSNAQAFKMNQNSISVGYGFGTIIGSVLNDIADQTNYHVSYTGPLYFKFENAVSEKVGFGINFAYAQYVASYNYYSGIDYTETDTYTTYSILGRINFHFGSSEKFDPYFGFGVGYRNGEFKYSTTDPNGPRDSNYSFPFPFGFETTIGSRLYFSENIGMYVEFGAAKSVLQLGLTAKF